MTAKKNRRTQHTQLKADFFPMTVLKLQSNDVPSISKELSQVQTTAPNYFNNAPVVIDVSTLTEHQSLDLRQLRETLLQLNMKPIGIRGLDKQCESQAAHHGFTILKHNEHKSSSTTKKAKPKPSQQTKIITKPIRAGTQVYAKDADLIVMAAVNAGAECIADGNIHIYGPLRGRAMAGANGHTDCHIFCQQLDAELLSIAGRYLVKDNMQLPKTQQPMLHVFVQNDQLTIEGI